MREVINEMSAEKLSIEIEKMIGIRPLHTIYNSTYWSVIFDKTIEGELAMYKLYVKYGCTDRLNYGESKEFDGWFFSVHG